MNIFLRKVSATLAAALLINLSASHSTAPRTAAVTQDGRQAKSTLKSRANPSMAPPRLVSLDQKVDARLLELLFASQGERGSYAQRFVGAAEGTREPDGRKTAAYLFHIDPGNLALNQGSFSYQNAPDKPVAHNPQQADLIQAAVLQIQARELQYQAGKRGVVLNVLELASGIDLANQSPAAACVQQPDRNLVYALTAGKMRADNMARAAARFPGNACRFGFVDRLIQAKTKKQLSGIAAVIEARTWSYYDPESNRWSAAGFGNNPNRIREDQTRRTEQVVEALKHAISPFPSVLQPSNQT